MAQILKSVKERSSLTGEGLEYLIHDLSDCDAKRESALERCLFRGLISSFLSPLYEKQNNENSTEIMQ